MQNIVRRYSQVTLQAVGYIEVAILLSLVGFLIFSVFNLINPLQKFAQARDTSRTIDINQMLYAISTYQIANQSSEFLNKISACPNYTSITIGEEGNGNINLEDVLVPKYIAKIPTDPLGTKDETTGYGICNSEGRISIKAFQSELKSIILIL